MNDILLTEEERNVKYEARKFAKSVSNDLLKAMDREEINYPHEYVKEVATRNLLGLRFSPKYGGRGLKWTAEVAVIEEIGVLGASLGCLYSLPSIVGECLNLFGTEEQKQKYLVPVLKGRKYCAEALTEPRGGSDFFGATTRAVKEGDEFVINGQKRFVVGSEGADFFLVYAKTDPDAHPHQSISTFIVEREHGIQVKHVYGLLGTRGGGTGRLLFKDVKVPEENLVGSLNAGGKIFNHMMVPERLTSAAGAIGSGRAALEVAARYSTKRKAFNKYIKEFEGVSFKIADSITALDAARGLLYLAAKQADSDKDPRRLVSEAKKFCTEAAWEVVNHSMQILGGVGYTNIYPVEKLLRDIRLMLIWTGTNEIMNLLIQHEYYKELQNQDVNAVRDIEKDAIGYEFTEEKHYG
ncbi:MAG: acyl-CoA dehydrogenase family protein [Candidatus Hodarchaeales archaeon]|jgi:alkylation response protein AidB-like acyl-CoA dehydrogenase